MSSATARTQAVRSQAVRGQAAHSQAAHSQAPRIQAEGLVKHFERRFGRPGGREPRRIVAVDGLSFQVDAGETMGLLGPNGAGKTTTLHLLTGVLRPDAGRVVLVGEVDPTRPSVRRQIGIAPQEPAIYDELTGEENLRLFGRLYGLSGRALGTRVGEVLERVGLSARRQQRAGEYSGGMRRRLSLAGALVHDPLVVLLDEPTVGVDPQSRNLLFDCIRGLRAEGRTVLFSTHYMEEAERLCDRVAIMDRGKLLDLDTVDGLIRRHGGPPRVEAELGGHGEGSGRDAGSVGSSRALQDGWPPSVEARLEGRRLTLTTEEPLAAVAELARRGVRVERLTLERASLETVFLHLTGRSLRDD